jgi:homeobox protein cut-like
MMKSSSAVDIVMVQQQNATLAAWKEVAWNVTLQQMQEQATSHRMQREQSQQARRALAETTKQFKKSVRTAEQAVAAENSSCSGGDAAAAAATAVQQSVTALAALCKVTIKAYQQEIDNLTVRCKASEQAYAGMTQALQELPDPAVVLAENQKVFESQEAQMSQLLETVENLNQELQASQETNEKYQQEIQALREAAPKESGLSDEERAELVQLRTEVAEYEVEFRSLKNQDVTIRKLQDKIKELQVEGAESLEKSIAQAKEELAATEGRRAAEALEREAAMERKLRSLELQLQAERAGREATESVVLDQDEGLSRREAAWEAQRKILLDDNNRIREAFQTVSRERDELKMKLSAWHDETPVSGGDTTTPRSMSQRTPPSSSAGGGPSVQDLMLERNAYEAEVYCRRRKRGDGY